MRQESSATFLEFQTHRLRGTSARLLYYSADMALACVAMFKSQKSLVAFASYAQETKSDENLLILLPKTSL